MPVYPVPLKDFQATEVFFSSQREHADAALQKMKFINFFLFLWVIFALLESGS
jgi:hypothetical protein